MKISITRIQDDRNNQGSVGETQKFLLHSDAGRDGIFCSRRGLLGQNDYEVWASSSLYPEISEKAGSKTTGGNQRDSGLTFPAKVQAIVAVFALFIVGAAWTICRLLMTALELMGKVSHLSGFWWSVSGAVAYVITCLIFYSILKVASLSDQQVAEMGGQR